MISPVRAWPRASTTAAAESRCLNSKAACSATLRHFDGVLRRLLPSPPSSPAPPCSPVPSSSPTPHAGEHDITVVSVSLVKRSIVSTGGGRVVSGELESWRARSSCAALDKMWIVSALALLRHASLNEFVVTRTPYVHHSILCQPTFHSVLTHHQHASHSQEQHTIVSASSGTRP